MVRQTQSNRKQQRKQNRQLKKQKKAEHFKSIVYGNKPASQLPHRELRKTIANSEKIINQKPRRNQNKALREQQDPYQMQVQQYEQGNILQEVQEQDDFQGFYQEGEEQFAAIEKDQQIHNMELQQNEDDEMIRYYEEKLNKAGTKNYKNLSLKENGFDKDFFGFLDDISHKVRKGKKYQTNLEESEIDTSKRRSLKQQRKNKKVKQNISQQQNQSNDDDNVLYPQQSQKLRVTLPLIQQTEKQKEQDNILRKSLNSLINKVSDGNILKISRQINAIFLANARSKVYACFTQLFLKSTVQNQKIQSHILAANVALACGLHHLYDNQFFAPLVAQLVQKFDILQGTPQVVQTTQDELQLNPILQKKKNCLKIFCYMYMLGSITIDFIKQFFFEFTRSINHSNIELLYLLVTTVGAKIRSDDPKVLKDIIEYIQLEIGESKNEGYQENNKVKFILHELNELKLNKKCLVDPDQRFSFLVTFIKKNVLQQNALAAKLYLLTLNETRQKYKDVGFWWQPNLNSHTILQEQEQTQKTNKNNLNEQTVYLEDLARQQKMVTQKKKKIFIAIMKSQDYIEATENILMLKIKNQSQIADVIVEICSQQKTFNPFYVYLASKLIQCSIRFKNAFKFAIWNHKSQFENYTFRKISNIAKLISRLVILNSECSLAFFKNLGDLMNLDKFNQIYFMIALQEFFENVSMERMNQLITKIRVGDNNKDFKRNFQEFLEDDYYKYCKNNKKQYKDKVKIATRLLKIQDQSKQDQEQRE